MDYVQSVMTPGEKVIYQAKTHWCIYVAPIFWLFLSITMTTIKPIFASILFILCAAFFLRAWLYSYSTELVVTSKRIIAKFGFIKRRTIELRNDKVESLHVDQSILGRIFNFGSVVVTGSGGTDAPIPYIANPLKFRSAALTQSEPGAS